ncbi:unnamed protein product [Rotaria sp. Silwood1]|nr:unnamed protein product [Rotaria sp. Silwood1]
MYVSTDVVNPNTNSNNLESIIFEINYNTNLHSSCIVANITCYSQLRDEEEFLFDLGTVFEIEKFFYNDDKKCWMCKMIPSGKAVEIAKKYVNFQRNEMNDGKLDVLVLFGNLLYDVREYSKCHYYFENLLTIQSDKNAPTIIDIYRGLGRVFLGISEFELSKNANTNNIGKSDYKKCQYTEAMRDFKESLDVARRVLQGNDNYRDMVLKLIEKANLNDHVDLGYTLKNIDEDYLDLLNFDLVLNYFTQALDIYKKTFDDLQHRDVAKCLNLIGEVYYGKNNHDDDSTCHNYYSQALNI